MYYEEQQIIDMIEVGAIGYLQKKASKDEIHEAILAAQNNDSYYCKHTTNKITKAINTKINTNNSHKLLFKDIEIYIIKLICDGLTSK